MSIKTRWLSLQSHRVFVLAFLFFVSCGDSGGSTGGTGGGGAGGSGVMFTVTTDVTPGGAIDPISATVSDGGTTNFTLTPDSGFVIASASGCGGSLSGSTYNTGAITEDCTVTVMFDTVASRMAYLKASNTGTGDTFGTVMSLSTDGSTLAVGAPFERSAATGVDGNQSDDSLSGAGGVYIFTRSGTSWVQQAYLKASNTDDGDQFGNALSLSGDGNTLVVAAHFEASQASGVDGDETDNMFNTAGAAYVFVRDGDSWSQQAYLKASNPAPLDQFGDAVSISGDGNTLAVGARGEDSDTTGVNNGTNELGIATGAVYVFTRSGSMWTQQAFVKPSVTGNFDVFGTALALSSDGDVLAIGAAGEDGDSVGTVGDPASLGEEDSGAVYVFTRAGNTWSQQAYIKASNTGEDDDFGFAISVNADGSTLAVGARSEDSASAGVNGVELDDSAGNAGAVYVFVRAGTTWSQQAYVKASNPDGGDLFGWSVCLSDSADTMVVGARLERSAAIGLNGDEADNSFTAAGAAYVFTRTGTTWTQRDYVKATNTEAQEGFGTAVGVSGDGQILAVGSPLEDSNATGVGGDQDNNDADGSGAVYVY